MIVMLATQMAFTFCLGCVPLDAMPDVERGPWKRDIDTTELFPTPNPEDGAEPNGLVPQVSVMSLSASNWSSNEDMLSLRAEDRKRPRPLRYQMEEQWTAKWTFTAPSQQTGLGLDVAVEPRATFEKRGQVRTARAGAEVRLGQNLEDAVMSLDKRGQPLDLDSWYFFAATDNEALCWDVGDNIESVALRDQVTVGDIQAGVAFHKAGGALSIGYVHREFSSLEGVTAKEDFAAISFTIRR